MTIYSEKSINHTAFRIRYDQIHPEIPEFYHSSCSVYQSSSSKWPLPAELYLVFSEENNSIQFYYSQILKSKDENVYIVAHKSGYLNDCKKKFTFNTFLCCHEANRYLYSTLSAIHHIVYEQFIKLTDKLFTFEPNFVMQNKVFLRRACTKPVFVLTGQNSAVDLLLQAMIPVSDLTFSHHFEYGTYCTPFGYPNKYAIEMAKSYLRLIKQHIGSLSISEKIKAIHVKRIKEKFNFALSNNYSNEQQDVFFSNNHNVFELSVLLKMITFSYTDNYLPIRSNKQVQEMQLYLDALQSTEIAHAYYQRSTQKIDAQLAKLKHPLKYMDKNSVLYYQIETCVKNTSSLLDLVDVFQYDISEEYIKEVAANKHLLWHGTNVHNVYSILKNGFDISRANKGLYGKGVYFADAVGKSQMYCKKTRDINNRFRGFVLLLCEVKLGKIGFPNANEIETMKSQNINEIETLKSQYDSFVIKGKLRPKDEAFFRDNFAAKFYSQSLSNNDDCKRPYGEFVVFDTKRIKIRYVVHCEFKTKHLKRLPVVS